VKEWTAGGGLDAPAYTGDGYPLPPIPENKRPIFIGLGLGCAVSVANKGVTAPVNSATWTASGSRLFDDCYPGGVPRHSIAALLTIIYKPAN